jgi:hypothetical protein
MMRIGRPPTANQARLLHHMTDMVAVTNAARFGEDQQTLIDLYCPGTRGHTQIAYVTIGIVAFRAFW